jgi:hypothetical protein
LTIAPGTTFYRRENVGFALEVLQRRFHIGLLDFLSRNLGPCNSEEFIMENCWEVKKCGREKECPAYPKWGRECFVITGTMCRGEQQGTYEQKIAKCRKECEFYNNAISGT